MNTTLSPLLQPSAWPQTAPLHSSSPLSPDVEVDRLEREAGSEGDHPSLPEWLAYQSAVRGRISKMRALIVEMRAQGFGEGAIGIAIGKLIQQFNESKTQFYEGNAQFAINKSAVLESNSATALALAQCTPDFSPFLPLAFDEENFPSFLEKPKEKAAGSLAEAAIVSRKRLVEERKWQAVETMKLDASLAITANVLTEGLDREEAFEVLQAANDAAYGASINEVTAPIATAGRLLNGVISAGVKVVKAAVKGQAHEFCSAAYHSSGAASSEQCLSQLTRAIDGEDPEVNRAVAKAAGAVAQMLPKWSIKAAKTVMKAEEALHRFDEQMVEKYHTTPGTIHESISMATGIGRGMVVGAAFKKTFRAAKEAIREGTSFLKSGESGLPALWSIPSMPQPLQQPPFLLRLSDIHFPQLLPLPIATKGDRPLVTRRWNLLQGYSSKSSNPIHREVAHNNGISSRTDYSKDYVASKNEFLEVKEFYGKLSKDLYVVQYHSSAPLGVGRSHKWFMPVIQGNRCITIDEVQEVIAKLSSWGEITEVTLAKIPAGETVRFYHGKAKSQVDKVTREARSGGGIQYRFFDFDPDWVVCRKELP